MKGNSGYNLTSSIGSTDARTAITIGKLNEREDPYASFVESNTNTMDAYMTPNPISKKMSMNMNTSVSK